MSNPKPNRGQVAASTVPLFLQGDNITTRPMRYPVMVRSIKDQKLGEIQMGHIVTHMAIEDYCEQHGLYLQELFPGSRRALSYERTELF